MTGRSHQRKVKKTKSQKKEKIKVMMPMRYLWLKVWISQMTLKRHPQTNSAHKTRRVKMKMQGKKWTCLKSVKKTRESLTTKWSTLSTSICYRFTKFRSCQSTWLSPTISSKLHNNCPRGLPISSKLRWSTLSPLMRTNNSNPITSKGIPGLIRTTPFMTLMSAWTLFTRID